MYHSNSSAVAGHELPSEAERSHDWRGVIDWKNSSCWWNQGEDYCGKSSSLVSCASSMGESPGLGSAGTGTARGVAPSTRRGRDFIPYTGWTLVLQGNMAILTLSLAVGKGMGPQALCQGSCVGLAQFHLDWQNWRWLTALTGSQSCLLCQTSTVQSLCYVELPDQGGHPVEIWQHL